MNLWNVKELPVPPVTTCSSSKKIDVDFLKKTLTDGYEFFSEQPELASEAAILSRVIYRMKLKFRSSKDFKSLERLNHALLNYLHLKLPVLLRNFNLLVPGSYVVNATYMPSKNLLDYILVRLQGLGKLLWRILESCKIASEFAYQRMRLGHFWQVALITCGLVARIFVILKNMIKFTCDLYSNLRPYSFKLSFTGSQWLPQDYHLPESLSDWLNIDWLDLENTIIEIPDEEDLNVTSYFNLIEDSDDEDEIIFSGQYILIDEENKSGDRSVIEIFEDKVKKEKLTLNGFNDDMDVGEAVREPDADESVIFVGQTTPEFIPIPSTSDRGKKRKHSEEPRQTPKLSKKALKRRSFMEDVNQRRALAETRADEKTRRQLSNYKHQIPLRTQKTRNKNQKTSNKKQKTPNKKQKKRYFNQKL